MFTVLFQAMKAQNETIPGSMEKVVVHFDWVMSTNYTERPITKGEHLQKAEKAVLLL